MIKNIGIAAAVVVLNLASVASNAQQVVQPEPKPYIEVSASAFEENNPDKISLTLTFSGTKKADLDAKEMKLRAVATRAGLNNDAVSLADALGDLEKKWIGKDQVNMTRTYKIEVKDAVQAEKFFDFATTEKADAVGIQKLDMQERESIENRVQTKTVANALKKAEAMLAPTKAKIGKIIYVQDGGGNWDGEYNNGPVFARAFSMKLSMDEAAPMGFKKIKYQYNATIRFEILQ